MIHRCVQLASATYARYRPMVAHWTAALMSTLRAEAAEIRKIADASTDAE